MSAMSDISAAATIAPQPKPGWSRLIFIGDSAYRAIIAEVENLKLYSSAGPTRICGIELRRTNEFKGWAIRYCDRQGGWHEFDNRERLVPLM